MFILENYIRDKKYDARKIGELGEKPQIKT